MDRVISIVFSDVGVAELREFCSEHREHAKTYPCSYDLTRQRVIDKLYRAASQTRQGVCEQLRKKP